MYWNLLELYWKQAGKGEGEEKACMNTYSTDISFPWGVNIKFRPDVTAHEWGGGGDCGVKANNNTKY